MPDDIDYEALAQIARNHSTDDEMYRDWAATDPSMQLSDETKAYWIDCARAVVAGYREQQRAHRQEGQSRLGDARERIDAYFALDVESRDQWQRGHYQRLLWAIADDIAVAQVAPEETND